MLNSRVIRITSRLSVSKSKRVRIFPFKISQKWLIQALKFSLVGVTNTIIDWGFYFLITRYVPFFVNQQVLAKAISYWLGILNSFYLNKTWTFKDAKVSVINLIPFAIFNFGSLIINTSLLSLFLNTFHYSELWSLTIATLGTLLWNFLVSKFLIFNPGFVKAVFSNKFSMPLLFEALLIATGVSAYLFFHPLSINASQISNPLVSSIQTVTKLQSQNWSTYLFNSARTGNNQAEELLNKHNASNLELQWSVKAGTVVTAQAAVVDGISYWGDWNGFMHATDSNGKKIWDTFIGVTDAPGCNPHHVGVASSASIDKISVNGTSQQVVIVGGGDSRVYSLDAKTGAINWVTSLGQEYGSFIYSSPILYKGSVIIGKSSVGDCPLVQGTLVRLNEVTGEIENTFKVVPDGCIGGGIWVSPTIDNSTGMLYLSTGTIGGCFTDEIYGYAVLKMKASDLSVVQYWHLPLNEQVEDGDFSSTATLFTGSVGGHDTKMVGLGNKNGYFYAFTRDNISGGPVWKDKIDDGGPCPQCGNGLLSSAGWDGHNLYIAGGLTTINNQNCQGSIQAIDPSTGKIIWQECLIHGPVLAAVTLVPGLVLVVEGSAVDVIDTSTGQNLRQLSPALKDSTFFAPATVSQGIVYIGNLNGYFYSFDVE